MLESNVKSSPKSPSKDFIKGCLYQSDVHGDKLVVLCLGDNSLSGDVDIDCVIVHKAKYVIAACGGVGTLQKWSKDRLEPFLGVLELSNLVTEQ